MILLYLKSLSKAEDAMPIGGCILGFWCSYIWVGFSYDYSNKYLSSAMNDAGFDVLPMEIDLANRTSIQNLITEAQKYGEIMMLVSAAGVSPSQASIETILQVDLYGTAVLLEEVENVAELLMSDKGAFITGADFLIDGGATVSYFYGPLKP